MPENGRAANCKAELSALGLTSKLFLTQNQFIGPCELKFNINSFAIGTPGI
jgi:hypothetical protein